MPTTKPIAESGWTNKFTSAIGYYFLRERGEDTADASIIEYQGGERAYISGADDNFYKEWTSGRFEFLGPFTPSDFEQLIQLRKIAEEALRFRVEMNGPCNHEEYMTTLCTQCEIREALTPKGEQS